MITENYAIPFQWFKENFKFSRVASQNKISTFSWHQAIMFVIYEKWLMVDQELKKNKDFFFPHASSSWWENIMVWASMYPTIQEGSRKPG